MKSSRKRKKKQSFSVRQFNIESVNGIEIASTTASADDKLTDTLMQQIIKLPDTVYVNEFETPITKN